MIIYYLPAKLPTFMINSRSSIRRKLTETKLALDETIKRIMDINRKRKGFSRMADKSFKAKLEEELKVLNATADIQARVLRRYQKQIKRGERA